MIVANTPTSTRSACPASGRDRFAHHDVDVTALHQRASRLQDATASVDRDRNDGHAGLQREILNGPFLNGRIDPSLERVISIHQNGNAAVILLAGGFQAFECLIALAGHDEDHSGHSHVPAQKMELTGGLFGISGCLSEPEERKTMSNID
ncbi:MAG: hypothetical protein U0787_08765 [Polyangia bacterium]